MNTFINFLHDGGESPHQGRESWTKLTRAIKGARTLTVFSDSQNPTGETEELLIRKTLCSGILVHERAGF